MRDTHTNTHLPGKICACIRSVTDTLFPEMLIRSMLSDALREGKNNIPGNRLEPNILILDAVALVFAIEFRSASCEMKFLGLRKAWKGVSRESHCVSIVCQDGPAHKIAGLVCELRWKFDSTKFNALNIPSVNDVQQKAPNKMSGPT